MDREPGETPRAHLLIQDRPVTGPEPHGHAVSCPRRGAIHLVECLVCEELDGVEFDRDTNMTFIECRPKVE